MKPPPFNYHDPKTVAEVVGLLATLENAKLLAGGQSLMPMLNFRYVQPDHIIDLNRGEVPQHGWRPQHTENIKRTNIVARHPSMPQQMQIRRPKNRLAALTSRS